MLNAIVIAALAVTPNIGIMLTANANDSAIDNNRLLRFIMIPPSFFRTNPAYSVNSLLYHRAPAPSMKTEPVESTALYYEKI